jgi:hypothetical protein
MIKIETIGNRSTFKYEKQGLNLYILFGNSTKTYLITPELIQKVRNRVLESPIHLKYKASNYNKPHWQDCPNNRTCPYIAQLIIKGII